jgi:hypothetical protein
MAWVSVHEQLRDHRKVRDLMRELSCSRQEAIGTLVMLWTWAINNADKFGNLFNTTETDIEDGIMSRGQSGGRVVDALVKTAWIDQISSTQYCLHDWDVWQKHWYDAIDKRERDSERKRRERANKSDCPMDSHKDSPVDGHAVFPRTVHPDVRPSPSQHRHNTVTVTTPSSSPETPPIGGDRQKPKNPDPERKPYGKDFKTVMLSDDEYQKLTEKGAQVRDYYIDRLDGYIQQIGVAVASKKYKSHYATILNWMRRDEKDGKTPAVSHINKW